MMLSSCTAIQLHLGDKKLGSGDSYLSYLPVGSMFEQQMFCLSLVYSFKVGFMPQSHHCLYSIVNSLKLLKPTIFPAVPSLLTTIY